MSRLDEIYAKLPALECKRHCYPTCSSIVPLEKVEADRLARRYGIQSTREPGKGKGKRLRVIDSPHQVCTALRGRDCAIYPDRPFVCRLYGVAEGFECRWGCKPERYLSRDEAARLLAMTMKAKP